MSVMKKRWIFLSISVLLLLFMGIAYAFSLFVVAIESDLGFTRTETSLAFTLCFVFFSLGSLLAGVLQQKISPKLLLLISSFLIGFGFYSTTLISHAWQLYILYSCCVGLSIGCVYNVVISIIPLYFQDKPGLATGILLMGFAMSTTLFGPLCEYGVTHFGWKEVFTILAILSFVIVFINAFTLQKPSNADLKYLPMKQSTTKKQKEYRPLNILKMKQYYVFVLLYILIGGVGISLINHAAITLQEDLLLNAAKSAWLVSFICLFNGIGRIFWGFVFDRKGGYIVLKRLGVLILLATLCIVVSLLLTNIAIFTIGCVIALLCYGGSSSIAPILIRDLYGDKYFSLNFAITNIGTMVLSCVPTLVGMLQMINHNYILPYCVLFCFSVCAFGLSMLYQTFKK